MNKNEFKKIIEKRYSGNPNVHSFKITEHEGCYLAKLDCGAFRQFVVVDPETDYKQYDTVALAFKVDGMKYAFSIYDLFAFFKIDNYNVYTFEAITNETILNEILDIYDSVVDEYYSFLKSLSTDEKLKNKLSNMLVDDLHLEAVEDEPDFEQIKKEELSELTKPYNCVYSGFVFPLKNNGKRSKQKIIKELEKYEDKLDTYEKRALAYLNSGGEMPKPLVKSNKASSRKYYLIMLGITLLVSIIPALALTIRNVIVFGDGYVANETIGLKAGMSVCFSIVIFVAVTILFAPLILKIITPNEIRDITIKHFEDAVYDKITTAKGKLSTVVRKLEKVLFKIAMVVAILFSFFMLVASNDSIAFYDDSVKFSSATTFETVEADYNDIKVYIVEGELDENDSFVDDEDDYVIVDNNCNYFQITDVEPNGETERLINEKAEQYSIEIQKVKLFEDIKELAD